MPPYKASPRVTLLPSPPFMQFCSQELFDEKYFQVLPPHIAQCSSKQGISLPHSSNTLFFAERLFFFCKTFFPL